VLAKDTHGTVIRLAPPLVIKKEELDWMVEQIEAVLSMP
jgi:ornithine--oxo-acid transaminase